MQYIVNVSGGLTSYEALRRTIERHGKANTTAVFADTRIEDPDLYRFLDDIERLFNIRIVRLQDGRTVFDIWHDTRSLTLRGIAAGGGIAPCSKILKKQQIDGWLRQQDYPYTLVFGMDWSEPHRMERLVKRYDPVPCWFPLAEKPYVEKCDIMEQLESIGIAVPALYLEGFSHNNCGGGCVLGGQSHFAHLWKVRPDTYARWEAEEERLRVALNKDIAILNDRRGGGPRRALPLSVFRGMLERGERTPRDEFGGCGCFAGTEQLELDLVEEERI